MSNYHVLNQHQKEHRVSVVFHVPIPDQNNFAGVNLRVAVKQFLESTVETITSQCPFIDAGELTQLQNGELFEFVDEIDVDNLSTKAERKAQLDARFATISAIVAARVEKELDFWGLSINV